MRMDAIIRFFIRSVLIIPVHIDIYPLSESEQLSVRISIRVRTYGE